MRELSEELKILMKESLKKLKKLVNRDKWILNGQWIAYRELILFYHNYLYDEYMEIINSLSQSKKI